MPNCIVWIFLRIAGEPQRFPAFCGSSLALDADRPAGVWELGFCQRTAHAGLNQMCLSKVTVTH